MRSTLLLLVCACTPTPAAQMAPKTPGLHLLTPFEPGAEAAERLAARLPGIAANALALRGPLAEADGAAYESAGSVMGELVAGIAKNLQLDRPVWVFLLPAELRPTNLPELTDGGVVLLADEPEDMVVWRVLRGVALTHPALPAEGTLLSDVVRGGVASRFAISEVQADALAGDSPFVPYPPEMVEHRLPHLLAMVIHHAEEPKKSYQNGWLMRPDLELLGWLGTSELGDWSAWRGKGPADADQLTERVLERLEALADASDTPARPSGGFASDFALQLTHGHGDQRESILVTYKRGMALLRVLRENVPDRATRVLGRLDAEALQTFLEELETLELATITDHHDVTLDDPTRFQFTMHTASGSVAFGFDKPYPDEEPRFEQLVAAFDALVGTAERRD